MTEANRRRDAAALAITSIARNKPRLHNGYAPKCRRWSRRPDGASTRAIII